MRASHLFSFLGVWGIAFALPVSNENGASESFDESLDKRFYYTHYVPAEKRFFYDNYVPTTKRDGDLDKRFYYDNYVPATKRFYYTHYTDEKRDVSEDPEKRFYYDNYVPTTKRDEDLDKRFYYDNYVPGAKRFYYTHYTDEKRELSEDLEKRFYYDNYVPNNKRFIYDNYVPKKREETTQEASEVTDAAVSRWPYHRSPGVALATKAVESLNKLQARTALEV